jgi:hypothetical protein
MKLLAFLLSMLGLAALASATSHGSKGPIGGLVSERPISTLRTSPPQTVPNAPQSVTLLTVPTPTKLTTVPYTTRLVCETVFTTRIPCSTVTSHCVFPASTTAPFTVLLNGTTTSGVVCMPTEHLSTSWAPHKTRTWWTVGTQATSAVHESNGNRGGAEPRIPPPEWFTSRSISWGCKGEFCSHRTATTLTTLTHAMQTAVIPPPEWFSTRFPGGCAGTICPSGVAAPTGAGEDTPTLNANHNEMGMQLVPPPEWFSTHFPSGCAEHICHDPTSTPIVDPIMSILTRVTSGHSMGA